ncbi:hypothetical protein I6F26_18880 [Ensifer sp. IC3342]|nr:hypothetical protein [Ensifer sp. BRP08]MCA1448646.1 hypothetical protein [Ensifer sp. IC3342]
MYPLAEAPNPKPTRFADTWAQPMHTLAFYDLRYFRNLYEALDGEPVRPRDKVIMGMLASLGIEAGRPFNPPPKYKAAMERSRALLSSTRAGGHAGQAVLVLIVYGYATFAFIYNPGEVGLSTYDTAGMRKTQTVVSTATSARGTRSQLDPDARQEAGPLMRFCGGDEPFWSRSFKLADVELVE